MKRDLSWSATLAPLAFQSSSPTRCTACGGLTILQADNDGAPCPKCHRRPLFILDGDYRERFYAELANAKDNPNA